MRPVVMGVLNVTPDSFFDGGRYELTDLAVAHAERMVEDGAAIIDVGGESTRPGAVAISAAEEIARVLPVIRRVSAMRAVVSVDTSKPEVMRAAVDAGARMINDVRALREPGALEVAAATGVAVCLMHMRGHPRSMQDDPIYGDVTREVAAFLLERVGCCQRAGVDTAALVLDPGFGFGKTLEHNLQLLRGLRQIVAIGPPVLVGFSRKSMVGALTGRDTEDRIPGSMALAMLALQSGARIIRVHDVAPTIDAIRVWSAVEGGA